MKYLALDIGDAWTGIAISDELGMFARPLKTIASKELINSLDNLFKEETIQAVIVGYPMTMKFTESEQTKKVVATKEQLEQRFKDHTWKLWDERLTSAQAQRIKPAKTKSEKLESHALAAAIILQSFLDSLAFASDD